jgi:hypothetical protein
MISRYGKDHTLTSQAVNEPGPNVHSAGAVLRMPLMIVLAITWKHSCGHDCTTAMYLLKLSLIRQLLVMCSYIYEDPFVTERRILQLSA